MKELLQQAFSLTTAAGRRRQGRPALLVGAVVLMWWVYLVLGSDLPWLLAAIGASLIAVWMLRTQPGVAACFAIAAVTAAAPAVTCVILIARQGSGGPDVVAVLTGYILVAPLPALISCTLRPTLVTAPGNAILGSAVLLLGAIPSVVFGDHGEGPMLLILALTISVALICRRHCRAATTLLAPLPLVNGWTDLGRRTLPDGSHIERLLIGNGHAIACSTMTSAAIEKGSRTAARTAAATAAALGIAVSRVQPVILTEQESPRLERYLVNDGDIAASVIVTAKRHLDDVTRLAPHRRGHQRVALLTAALLPTSGTTR